MDSTRESKGAAGGAGREVPLSGIPRPSSPASARRWRAALAQTAAGLLLCEASLRCLTVDAPGNVPSIAGHVLLPYTPPRDASPGPYAAYVAPDPELGWSLVANGRTRDGLYEANPDAIRAPAGVRYPALPRPGRLRVVTVGDSFTHGDGVGIDGTWKRAAEGLRPDLEVINLGVPGYGTDQAYLRWVRDGARLRPHVAILGIWPENVCRNLNVVRFFLQPAERSPVVSKPRFVLGRGGLELVNAPALGGRPLAAAISAPAASGVLRHEYWALPGEREPRAWYRWRTARVAATIASLRKRKAMREALYSGEDPAGLRVTAAIAAAFKAHAERSGATPLVVILPMADLLAREGSRPLAAALAARGLDPLDLGPVMAAAVARAGRSRFYQPDGHLTAEGNGVVAGAIAARLGQAPMAASWDRHHFMSTKSDHARDQ